MAANSPRNSLGNVRSDMDITYPEHLSRLNRHLVVEYAKPHTKSRRQNRPRNRYRTQPVTFDEIKKLTKKTPSSMIRMKMRYYFLHLFNPTLNKTSSSFLNPSARRPTMLTQAQKTMDWIASMENHQFSPSRWINLEGQIMEGKRLFELFFEFWFKVIYFHS
ncbi:uncharacterized protein CEXT_638511 [Caerostris extrusa]|uniref:Uncharacterized protein n=1 Tax=Caerostris extrusa TaxID=172846 RepID=A0AAV4S8W8_CAEEX|nr:uncharacterized protein CEXT_638511 [Caerostris extrusa]